ncbi:MAG TPA: glycosyltransferase family 2 protein [Candidatus Saccharimonadales bacterium]
MSASKQLVLSVVVPVFNEAAGLPRFHESLVAELQKMDIESYEIIYCNDGSTDNTVSVIEEFVAKNPHTKLLSLSRNFGKEIATTAGIHKARGQAIITLDGDGQHPVDLLPQFVERWKAGAKVVVGRRTNYRTSPLKRLTSKLFYKFFKLFTGVKLLPEATDYRLIDRIVQQDFIRMTERSRMTRALIDWLGYPREYVSYTENPRLHGEATYSVSKLLKLAVDSVISTSTSPLYIAMYIGVVVLPLSVLLGAVMLLDALFGDPLGIRATGSAYVVVLMLFLIGVLLVSQGIIGLYLSHIHTETQNRPLYIIDEHTSKGLI